MEINAKRVFTNKDIKHILNLKEKTMKFIYICGTLAYKLSYS